MPSLKERLSEILIKNKLISPEQLEKALEVQKNKGGRLSKIIVELGFTKEKDLISSLSQGLGLPLIDLKRIKVDVKVLSIIPPNLCRHYQIIPISQMGDTLTIAMADPMNIFAIDALRNLTGFQINPIISTGEQILHAIDQFYPDSTSGIIEGILTEISDESKIELIEEKKKSIPSDQELGHASRQGPAIRVTNMILEQAIKKKASDILVEPFPDKLRIRFRIDGILHEQEAPPKAMHPLIISRIKVLSELNIAEHRLPQDGRFKIKLYRRDIDFRISILPSSLGEKAAIRILDKSTATLDVEKLGFDELSISKIKKSALLPHGMILVCGPTGSGKTTTLYSIIKLVDSPQKNIVTVEDPVEYQLEGINQVSIKPDINLTFASSLRSILRQDPNVIMIGEIRDFETVDIAIKSALTGHLVLSTLHTTTSSGAVVRLINMGVEPYLITSSLICIIAQRLVRRLCVKCREQYKLSKEMADKLEIASKPAPLFYRPKGCRHCLNTGYSGRLGIVEVLMFSSNIRNLILSNVQEQEIKQAACEEGMKTLRENALTLALNAETS
ncbi:MAG: Flp pilus assembly complex ATPase component TadA, partial [Candidatus Omnitrophica bacterium]|nr:Flp pilus assembly complex ATPase component TadA [Candidatus Omnitrophota bacterium]